MSESRSFLGPNLGLIIGVQIEVSSRGPEIGILEFPGAQKQAFSRISSFSVFGSFLFCSEDSVFSVSN